MKILITGGEGHVGSAIKRHLASQQHEVVSASRSGDIKVNFDAPGAGHKLASEVGRCHAIVHCAANLSRSLMDTSVSLVNCVGAQEVVCAADLLQARCLVYISSVAVIGLPHRLPIDEEHETLPRSVYHASKLYGEQIVRLAASEKLVTVSLRITSPVGPNTPRGRIFSEFVHNALNGLPLTLSGLGKRRQNYVDVRDISSAVSQCISAEVQGVFNVAGKAPISNLALAQTCVRVLTSTSAIVFSGQSDPEESHCWDVSINRAQSAFCYAPVYSIEQSIEAAAYGN